MGKLFCLMGKSATGKDSIYREIMSRRPELGRVVTYTTRPMRDGETPGKQYHFVDEVRMRELENEGRIIEKRVYPTVYGSWYYFTADDGQIALDAESYLMIGTLEAYVALRGYFGDEAVLPVYIEVEDGKRLERALGRERTQNEPKYEELCRRFLADAEDFSEKKLEEAGIEVRYINENLEACVGEILSFVDGETDDEPLRKA